MRVGDDGARHGPPRVDVEIAGRAIQALGPGDERDLLRGCADHGAARIVGPWRGRPACAGRGPRPAAVPAGAFFLQPARHVQHVHLHAVGHDHVAGLLAALQGPVHFASMTADAFGACPSAAGCSSTCFPCGRPELKSPLITRVRGGGGGADLADRIDHQLAALRCAGPAWACPCPCPAPCRAGPCRWPRRCIAGWCGSPSLPAVPSPVDFPQAGLARRDSRWPRAEPASTARGSTRRGQAVWTNLHGEAPRVGSVRTMPRFVPGVSGRGGIPRSAYAALAAPASSCRTAPCAARLRPNAEAQHEARRATSISTCWRTAIVE